MEGFGKTVRRTLVLATIAVTAAAASASPASAGGVKGKASAQGFFVGVDEDAVKWGRAGLIGSIANHLGLKALRLTVPWTPGETALSATQQAALDRTVLGTLGLRLVVSVYGKAADAPRTETARAEYCSYVVDLVRKYPVIDDVVLWNDPNDERFWAPQWNADGTSAAPGDYEALLAACWPVLHAVRPSLNVIALTATRAADVRTPGTAAHSVGTWYRRLGAAYKARARTTALFDTVGHIPHPDMSTERPWVQHTNGHIGQGDYSKLMQALTESFSGTPQQIPGQGKVTIWYLAQGFQTAAEGAKAGLYRGTEGDPAPVPTWSAAAANDTRVGPGPDQPTQVGDAIRIAACQPHVGAYFNFLLADEADLAGWQSGLFYPDWTPKPSYVAVRRAIAEVNSGSVNCAAFGVGGVPPRQTPVPAPAAELRVTDFRVADVASMSARVTYKTSLPATVRIAYGIPESGPTIWAAPEAGEATLPGLTASTTYRVWISAVSEDGQRASASVPFHTGGLPHSPRSAVRDGVLLVDGQPWFPMMVWNRCPYQLPAAIQVGINLFAENPCSGYQAMLNALGGKAFASPVAGHPGGNGAGALGWFHTDEPDGLAMTAADLPPRPAGADGVSFLTLTNHFYSNAAPLPWDPDRSWYPALIAKADIIGWDLYPLQEWCRPERIHDVFYGQRELVKLAAPRPTFQWIEAASWKCPGGRTEVTPAVVDSESWLAIAGGAQGLGFWGDWNAAVGRQIGAISRTLPKLGAALHAKYLVASATNPYVKAGGRTLNGAVYVFAANSGFSPVKSEIRVPGLGTRVLEVLDEDRKVVAIDGVLVDNFGGLGTHVYYAGPLGG